MIVAGMIVGASGTILTNLMAKAMNRSIPAIVFGAFGGGDDGGAAAGRRRAGTVKATSAADAAIQMAYANQVIVVPGYGLAVAQAQHAVKEMAALLEEQGRRGQVRDSSGRRSHARAHERAAGRGRRRVRRDEGNGRHQRRIRAAPTSRSSSAPTTSPTRPRATIRRARSTACRSSTSTSRGR